ncbi:hypothetical protein G7054_g9255 [Neopestalotiopsis clavispora]|nr:hypothetical protein G7054_g9255 [Neopestalotiopsis clavispora]
MANSRPAAARVLAIMEILVSILCEVDMHTLLVSCQRVCRSWKTTIDNFESLQRKLFFLEDAFATPTHNVLLAKHFPFVFEHANASPNQDLRFISLTKNPIAPEHDAPFPDLPWIKDRLEAYRRPEATWRRMLVQQPPFPGVGWIGTRRSEEVLFHRDPNPTRRGRLRMEELLQTVLTGFPRDNSSVYRVARSFRVIWRQFPSDIINIYPNVRAGVSQATVDTLRQAFAEQWSAFGIIAQIDVDDSVNTEPDPKQFVLFDLFKDDDEDETMNT